MVGRPCKTSILADPSSSKERGWFQLKAFSEEDDRVNFRAKA